MQDISGKINEHTQQVQALQSSSQQSLHFLNYTSPILMP